MAKDPIKKAENGTYYFRANLGYHPVTGKQIQKYRSGFSTKKEARLGHEKIQTTLGTYGHLYPNTNIEIAKKLTGVLSYQSASQSIANYTSNQHTAMYHKEI